MTQLYPSRLIPSLWVVCALLCGCNDRVIGPTIQPGNSPAMSGPDEQSEVEVEADEVAPLCQPGQRRCLAENSPLAQVCADNGRAYVSSSCPEGSVCRDTRCVPFTCVPSFSVCVGTRAEGVCGADGRSVSQVSDCPSGLSCRGGRCINLCEQAAEQGSYIGCDYIARELPNIYRLDGTTESHPFALVVANPHRLLPARVLVRRGRSVEPVELIEDMLLRPTLGYQGLSSFRVRSALFDQGKDVELTREGEAIVLPPGGAAALLIQRESAEHVLRVTSDLPVVAYQYSPYCCNFTATNDASLLLPTSTLGTTYRAVGYPSMSFSGFSSRAYLSVIAGAEDVSVTVRGSGVGHVEGGQDAERSAGGLQFKLSAYEEALVYATNDLSGAQVVASGPVAVFTGHPCTNTPQNMTACDHLEEQLPPSQTLGRRFLLPPLRSRAPISREGSREGVYWKIVADEPARIRFEPALSSLEARNNLGTSSSHTEDCSALERGGEVVLAAGQSCELGLHREAVAVTSDAPLVIAGVLSGHESTGVNGYGTQAGDPSLFIVPPIEQLRSSYNFVNPPTYRKTYATVAIPEGAPLVLDGRQVSGGERLELREIVVAGRRWQIFSVALSASAHTLESPERFLLLVYAYDDFVSYAFPGGQDLVVSKKESGE